MPSKESNSFVVDTIVLLSSCFSGLCNPPIDGIIRATISASSDSAGHANTGFGVHSVAFESNTGTLALRLRRTEGTKFVFLSCAVSLISLSSDFNLSTSSFSHLSGQAQAPFDPFYRVLG